LAQHRPSQGSSGHGTARLGVRDVRPVTPGARGADHGEDVPMSAYTPTLGLINWGAIRAEFTGALTVLSLAVVGVVIWAAATGNIKKVVMMIGGVLGAGVTAAAIALIIDPAQTKALFAGFFS
jgi:hypothetical protein